MNVTGEKKVHVSHVNKRLHISTTREDHMFEPFKCLLLLISICII